MNLHTEGVSRGATTTLSPAGAVNLKNLFAQPFYITCGEAAPLFYPFNLYFITLL